jgi:hypothetical protein
MRKILNAPIGVDENGREIYACHYTGKTVAKDDAIHLGAVTPQVKGTYICHPDAIEVRKSEVATFNETEQNCNTCQKLERIPHAKQHPAYPTKGICGKDNTEIYFHPEDWMGKPCWEARA